VIPLGLRRAELRAFERTLLTSHSIRVEAHVLNLDHERLANLTEDIDDGQVNIDADGETTRSLTMSFLDRRRSYDFDSDSPRNGALYLNRMLQIRYCVRVDSLDDPWVEVPIFTGPVAKMDRAGEYVNVECQGKETLAMGAAVEPLTIKKGTPKVDAIRRIMRERGGEQNRNMKLPDLNVKLPKAVSLGRESVPWQVAQSIAKSMNRQLFYDGRGHLRLERFGKNDVFTFDGDAITDTPQVAFDSAEVKNAVLIRGGKPKAKKNDQPDDDDKKEKERGIVHFRTAPRSHPLSPWRLGREEGPRYLLEVVENDKIRSRKEAEEVAQRLLDKRLQQMVDVTFSSLPVPHLEPEDSIRVQYDGLGLSMRLGQASIPFKHDGTMSVGFMDRVSVRRRKKNRR
jgi:hypothetical protein